MHSPSLNQSHCDERLLYGAAVEWEAPANDYEKRRDWLELAVVRYQLKNLIHNDGAQVITSRKEFKVRPANGTFGSQYG